MERPVKIVERSDVPFTKNSFGSGMQENFKFFLSAPKVGNRPVNKRLEVDWGGNFGGFVEQLKEFFSPTKRADAAGHSARESEGYLVEGRELWLDASDFDLACTPGLIALLIVPFITN